MLSPPRISGVERREGQHSPILAGEAGIAASAAAVTTVVVGLIAIALVAIALVAVALVRALAKARAGGIVATLVAATTSVVGSPSPAASRGVAGIEGLREAGSGWGKLARDI